MRTLSVNQIAIDWNCGQQKFCIVGGGLPRNVCWSAFDRLAEAVDEAHTLAEEMGLEIVQ